MPRFSDTLVDHATSPRNLGRIDRPDAVGQASYHGQPPYVTFYIRRTGDRLTQITFEAHGCGVTIAACSVLTELALGKTYAEAGRLDVAAVTEALDGVPPDKILSPAVAVAAFHQTLACFADPSPASPPRPQSAPSRS